MSANSLASSYQSTIGNVKSGSLFAKLQSLGAKGYIKVLYANLKSVGVKGTWAIKGLFSLKFLPWVAGATLLGLGDIMSIAILHKVVKRLNKILLLQETIKKSSSVF